jgi:hypothetical protein
MYVQKILNNRFCKNVFQKYQLIEFILKIFFQRMCPQNPDSPEKSGRGYGLHRASSVREARANTEDRTFGRSLSRQVTIS